MESRKESEQPKKTRKAEREARRAEKRVAKAVVSRQQVGRRRFLGGLGGVVGVAALITAGLFIQEQQKEKTFKEKVLNFTWEDTKNSEKLSSFVSVLADEYLRLTNTPRLKKEDLTGPGHTEFFIRRQEFIEAVRRINPDEIIPPSDWARANHGYKKVMIDLPLLERAGRGQKFEAGSTLISALWHEWGHVDRTMRATGELINHSSMEFSIISHITGKNEPFRQYLGGMVLSDTSFTFKRWDEVLEETITQRRIIEQVGLTRAFTAGIYDPNGADNLLPFTRRRGISINTLYNLYSTSDVEGQANLLGSNIPGARDSLRKGLSALEAFNESNGQQLLQLGIT